MSNKGRGFTREEVIAAIDGCGGIMSTVASRLGCHWNTAETYVKKWESTRQAFDNERKQFLDACESVLVQNVRLAMKRQKESQEIVDTADPKWVLSRLGKDRGYTERQQIDLRAIDLSQLTESQLQRLADGDALFRVLTTPG